MNIRTLAIATSLCLFANVGATLAATPAPVQGGANQKRAVEGCMNTWLFNGVWRMRVTGVEPIVVSGAPGFGVSVEVRNGTAKQLELGLTGVGGRGQGVALIADDGDSLVLDDLDYQRLGYKDIVQGASAKRELMYHFAPGTTDAAARKPAKFLLQIDPATNQVSGIHYAIADPSFRVDLTCEGAKAAT